MNKRVLIVGITTLFAAGFVLILFVCKSSEEHTLRASLVSFTDTALGPHAEFLLDGRGDSAWALRGVSYKEEGIWKSWIPPNRVPYPHEFVLYELGSNLLASVSVARTNVPSRIVFEVHEEDRSVSERLRRWWARQNSHSTTKRFYVPRTRVYLITNEISAPQ
jgi:hypothetical protein